MKDRAKKEKLTHYQILDVGLQANPEVIRTAYIRAKNAYNRDSLAAYSLFDQEDTKKILDEIEEAYTVLSDSEKRRVYDETHGIISSESVYSTYHSGNHAIAAFSRDKISNSHEEEEALQLMDPFRNQNAFQTSRANAAREAEANVHVPLSRVDAPLSSSIGTARSYQIHREFTPSAEMEKQITDLQNVTGTFLKSVREYKGISAEEMIDYLKISKNYLTALEEDNITKLPANVFVRGFVIQYAKILKMNAEKTASAYMTHLRSRRPG